MKTLASAIFGLAVAFAAQAAEKSEKSAAKKAVAALPPHPLDGAFARPKITDGLLNNDLFKKAVQEAAKARKEQEERFKKNPGFAGPTPAQAARMKFLKVLNGEDNGGGE